MSRKDALASIITRLAAVVALLVGISLPLGYLTTELSDVHATLAFKARIKAAALSGLISTNPELWMFSINRLQGLLAYEPVALDNELIQVFDGNGALITQIGQTPQAPATQKSHPLFDAGREVGRLAVSGSLRPLAYKTAASAALGLLLAALVFWIIRVVPLRALRRVTDALFEEKERAETTLGAISDAVISTDLQGHVRYLNPMAEHLLGVRLAAATGQALALVAPLKDEATGNAIPNPLYRALASGKTVMGTGTTTLHRADQSFVAVEERADLIYDARGQVTGAVMVLRDVSQSRAFAQQRSWDATHDSLTGLVNRREFEARVKTAIQHASSDAVHHVVGYLDLDNFKVVNDSCGHGAGDQMLIQIAQLMRARVRDTDTLARVGGDEFALLLQGCGIVKAQVIANDILADIRALRFTWDDKVFPVGLSAGLTSITADHHEPAEVIGEADSACYWAKDLGRNRVCVFQADDADLTARRTDTGWVARIHAAFEQNRLVLYQQSYRSLQAGGDQHTHLEVLLRMTAPDGSLISPAQFLPAALRYNLMPDIDRWVVKQVFENYPALVRGRAVGASGVALTCSINLSGASINDNGFLAFVKHSFIGSKLPRGAICFELTETVAVNNLQATVKFINECQQIGIAFALDDFGMGTSSFGYLKNLPVDYLKIDGSFVKNIEHDPVDRAMTETITRIGHILGKKVVAEYAENEAIIAILKTMGVNFAQGYGVCRPTPLILTEEPEPAAS